MRETIVKLYKFSELSDNAKEKARTWYREGALDYEWWDSVYDDAARIADILGINLRQRTVKLMGGGTRNEPAIDFSGFWSQGDGACFGGNYHYAKGATEKIREYAPKDTELHRIADELQKLQRRHFYKLSATVRHTGRYSHAHSTTIDVYVGEDDANADVSDELAELLRDYMNWIYNTLEKEFEYLNSNEQVDESIEAVEYEFTEDGERA